MNYISTRSVAAPVTSAQAMIAGLAPDGGLYLPESLPAFTLEDVAALAKVDYAQRAARVLSWFLTDFTYEELLDYAGQAYAQRKFAPPQVAPVVSVKDNGEILELFHGPTCAFKDFALQMLPFLLTASLKKTGEDKTVVILVATSGDTGKAALEGFADVPGTKICVFYPDGGTSPIQRLQMTSQSGDNVMVYAVKGNFDDAQSGVKRIFTDVEFEKELLAQGQMLSSANSINWGRLAPQIAYYVSAYCDLVNAGKIRLGDKINVVVPTGNFGNILAAYFAKHCGLPIEKLVCASNRNDVLTDFIRTGVYDKNRPFHLTTSPSMDILISSNLERLLYLLSGRDEKKVAGYMEQLAKTGRYEIDADMLEKLKAEFEAGSATDEEGAAIIRDVWKDHKYLCDTHTAVAVKVYRDYVARTGDETPTVIASTASPYKFAASVLKALDVPTEGKDDFALLDALQTHTGQTAPQALAGLKEKKERFTDVVEKEDMKAVIRQWLLG